MDAADRSLTAAFGRLEWRARVLAAAEAAGWGAALAALSPIAGAIVALAVGAWKSMGSSRPAIIRSVDRAAGGSNVLVTADELLRGALRAGAGVRARVVEDADCLLTPDAVSRAIRAAPAWRAIGIAVLCWTVAGVVSVTRDRVGTIARTPATAQSGPAASGSALHVTVSIDPPPYTGLPHTSVADPAEIRLVEGSRVAVTSPYTITVDHDGMLSDATFVATRTGYLTVKAGKRAQRVIPLVVSPDALPVVRLTLPGRDLVLADDTSRITFEARATDDYGLRSLTLQYTKVSGSGEEYRFDAGEIPLALTRTNGRDWSGSAAQAMAGLGLKDGDMIVYRASASDTKPGDRQSVSDAFFIEISALGIAAGDAFTLPEEETRYALSEQMLIIKTDRLTFRRASMPPADFTEASLNLAVEQRTIRAEFVFMLGGEIEDEEVEAERSIELQAGRLANRGQRDLRDATVAMSRAEQLLTAGDPAAALTAERAAVSSLQRAFARDRYLLRALASRTALDPARRLTGNRAGSRELRLPATGAPENRRAARLQDLVLGVGGVSRDLASGEVDRARVLVLAEAALRVDPDAPVLRSASADLQRVSDTWSSTSRDERARALDAITAALAAESRRALADPMPELPSTAPALQRALEAARSERR